MIWGDVFAHLFVIVGLLYLAGCLVGIFTPPPDYSSVPVEDEWDA